jgi:hypothetical protein
VRLGEVLKMYWQKGDEPGKKQVVKLCFPGAGICRCNTRWSCRSFLKEMTAKSWWGGIKRKFEVVVEVQRC